MKENSYLLTSANACPNDIYEERKTSMKQILKRITIVLLSCSLGHASLSYAQTRSIEEYTAVRRRHVR